MTARLTPCSRREFIRKLSRLGYEGPYPGGRHEFMAAQGKQPISLSEGAFVASYKYALLLELADLGRAGRRLWSAACVPLTAIAEQFIRMYWRASTRVRPEKGPRRRCSRTAASRRGAVDLRHEERSSTTKLRIASGHPQRGTGGTHAEAGLARGASP